MEDFLLDMDQGDWSGMKTMEEFALPDEMMSNAVHGASDFFGITDPNAILSTSDMGTSVTNYYPNTFSDDVLRFNRDELLSMGVRDKDAIDLVMTHETTHRIFQATEFGGLYGGAWEEELACDYFAGVRAGLDRIDVSAFRESLENTIGSVTHPTGELRADFIEYGKSVAEEMQEQGITPTFDNCLDALRQHLAERTNEISEARYSL